MPPLYIWVCRDTGKTVEIQNKIADSDLPPNEEGNWYKPPQAPLVAKRLIPSGFGIRQSDPTWTAGKEIAALEDSTLNMPVGSPERAAIKNEVKKIKRSTIK